MRLLVWLIEGVLGLCLWAGLLYVVWTERGQPAQYDCALASFHPDFPAKVKQACRMERTP